MQVVKLQKANLPTQNLPERWEIVVPQRTDKPTDGTKGIRPAPCSPEAMDANPGPISSQDVVFQQDWLVRIRAQ